MRPDPQRPDADSRLVRGRALQHLPPAYRLSSRAPPGRDAPRAGRSMSAAPLVEIDLASGAPSELSPAGLRCLARFTLAAEGATRPLAVSLVVTDDATIQALHAA